MRVLIVKPSSPGDVVHAAPVVHDIRRAFPAAHIDWVVEPAFVPLVQRIDGLHEVIKCALRRWKRSWWSWWTSTTRTKWRAFRSRLQRERYDAVIGLQRLTKLAVIARLAHGASYELANCTAGSTYEAPARWLVDHAVRIEPRTHVVDRPREPVSRALGHVVQGRPTFGLSGTSSLLLHADAPTVVFVRGMFRDDKQWPETLWIELRRKVIAGGWRVAIPHAGAAELALAQRLAMALGEYTKVWSETGVGELIDGLAAPQGVIGVDSGLSHIAVALGFPHVQIYNFPTSWRTGPHPPQHGPARQVCVERASSPTLNEVWSAWSAASAITSLRLSSHHV